MAMLLADGERGVESYLVDLSQISLAQLRTEKDAVLVRAMRRAVERLAKPQVWEVDRTGH